MIKIGDKVRFLNAVGGGKVVGFQDKNIVLVEEEDGFETPVLANEIVVVEAGDDMAKAMSKEEKKKSAGTTTQSLHAAMNQGLDDEDEAEIKTSASARPSAGSEDEAPYFTDDLDSADGEKINISLAFMPVTEDKLQNTDFDLYLINDDNYFVSFFISTKDDSSFENEEERWVLREQGTIEPHTRLLLNRITNGHAGDWERINVQAIAFKDKRSFVQKPAFNASLHLSPTRLYKQNAFTANDYFDRNALVLAVVKDDRQAAPTAISAESIEEAIVTKSVEKAPALKTRIEKKEKKDDILEIDLHIDKLLDDTTGMQPKDILDYQVSKFRQTMEAHKKEKGKRIVFIHGKGEGVLRKELWKRLTLEYPSCDKQDASFLRYGFGATMVTIG
ncbi:MAG: DUF2027 domain-containing protein [Paludibacteraceae bacterium]|nr:DUF2027 domain-containing protein [Paludibacteraceae bacterium]MBR0498141.1 DUF2027 domain-containing protein [Paludibacteraceae bacterium]